MVLKRLELSKENEMINEWKEINEMVKILPHLTQHQRKELIKKLQEFSNYIKNNKELIEQFAKSYPIKNKKGEYTGTYFKILIEWCTLYNVIDKTKVGMSTDKELREYDLKLESIIKEMRRDYTDAIENSEGKIKRNMQYGMKNMEKFYEYGKEIIELTRMKLKNQDIKEVLDRNPNIFWMSISEKGNIQPINSIRKAISELEIMAEEKKDNKEIKETIEMLKRIEKTLK